MKYFAAIDVGSYQLEMKVYEISRGSGITEIDSVRYQLDLGTDSYARGKLSVSKVEELCHILNRFSDIMKGYKVDAYRAYGTSALREVDNHLVLLDQIRQRTGIEITLISNSEQRLLDHKAVAMKQPEFNRILENGTVIAAVGGGSIQLSLFENGSMTASQNMKLGILRLQDRISHLDASPAEYENLIDEMVASQLSVFRKLYSRDREYENLIVVDDYISPLMDHNAEEMGDRCISSGAAEQILERMRERTLFEISREMGIAEENVSLTFISAVLLNRICKKLGVQRIYVPGAVLCDGIAYEYAEAHRLLDQYHDFDQDIITEARAVSKRYMGSKKRGETLQQIALHIYDSMKKIHGLGKRERLLLQIATLLHDCGKYISLVNLGECSYNIILYTEIIGLSHREREIVANVVKYNHIDFDSEEVRNSSFYIDEEAFLVIAKLTAILKLANGLDRSHKQKFQDVSIVLKEDILQITVDADVDITLEKGLFGNRANFFEEVYSVKPVITQRKGR